MKKIIVLASLLGAALLSNAQVSFGPVVGIGVQGPRSLSYSSNTTSTTVTTNDAGQEVDRQNHSGGGAITLPAVTAGLSYNLGVQAKIELGKYVALSPSLVFMHTSSKSTSASFFGTFTSKESMNYISLPILLQGQYPINDKITVGLGVGPQFSFFVGGKGESTSGGVTSKSKLKGKSTIKEADAESAEKANSDTDLNNNIDYVKPLLISLNIAPFVQFKLGGMSLLVSPTYYIGLSNIYPASKYTSTSVQKYGTFTSTTTNNIDEKPSAKLGGFGLNVALLFGGGK